MKLYKYVKAARIDILTNCTVRFTQPAALNDPFELSPGLKEVINDEGRKKVIQQFQRLASANEEIAWTAYKELCGYQLLFLLYGSNLVKEFSFEIARARAREYTENILKSFIDQAATTLSENYNNVRDHLHQRFGILSLSEKNDSLLMWAHYADSHFGFLLEIDGDHPQLDQSRAYSGLIGKPQKVRYSRQRPLLQLYDPNTNAGEAINRLAEDFFLVKSEEWAYEQEWRMILPVHTKLHLGTFPPECLTGVILGSRMTSAHKQQIQELLSSSDHFSHVGLRHAVIDPDKFQVNIT